MAKQSGRRQMGQRPRKELPAYLQARMAADRAAEREAAQSPFSRARFLTLAVRAEDCPSSSLPELAFSGRSNVGKSSLINALCGRKALARSAGTPGKTRYLVYFEVPDLTLICDLPGYGYAKVSAEERQRFSALVEQYFASGRPLRMVLHLMDCRMMASDDDRLMLDYLRDRAIPHALILTKVDKLGRAARTELLRSFREALKLGETERIFALSSLQGTGLAELRDFLLTVLRA